MYCEKFRGGELLLDVTTLLKKDYEIERTYCAILHYFGHSSVKVHSFGSLMIFLRPALVAASMMKRRPRNQCRYYFTSNVKRMTGVT